MASTSRSRPDRRCSWQTRGVAVVAPLQLATITPSQANRLVVRVVSSTPAPPVSFAAELRSLSHHPRSHGPLLVYHRALERIDERTAQFSRHVQQSLMVDEKARRPVRHHITATPE